MRVIPGSGVHEVDSNCVNTDLTMNDIELLEDELGENVNETEIIIMS